MIAQDKVMHFVFGALITSNAPLLALHWSAPLVACVLAALGKDLIWDKWLKRGEYEPLDIVTTLIGGSAGVVMVLLTGACR